MFYKKVLKKDVGNCFVLVDKSIGWKLFMLMIGWELYIDVSIFLFLYG